jgi:putative transposase
LWSRSPGQSAGDGLTQPTYEPAKKALMALKPERKLMNQSALSSLEEGMEETLTLHRLDLLPLLGTSFRTTNCIENVNSLLQQLTHNALRWTNSSQRHRWVATALLDIEPRLRRIRGYRHLPMLRQSIQAELGFKQLAKAGWHSHPESVRFNCKWDLTSAGKTI